jgi:hypothetical protein
MRRSRIVAVLAIAVVLVLTACQRSAAPGFARALPAAGGLLVEATKQLEGESFSFTFDDGSDPVSGTYDAGSQTVSTTSGPPEDRFESVVTGNDLYIRVTASKGKWLHLATAKIPSGSPKLLVADPLFGWRMLATAKNVERDGTDTVRGVYDFAKATGDPASATKRLAQQCASATGSAAAPVAFVATVDAQRRLVRLQTRLPNMIGGEYSMYDLTIVGPGAAGALAVPNKSTVIEAPAQVYRD